MFSKGPKHVNGRGPTGTKALLRTLDAKLKRNVDVMVVLAMAGNLLMVAEVYELWARSGVASTTCEVLKLLSSFTTLWLLAFLAWYYQRKFQQMKKLRDRTIPGELSEQSRTPEPEPTHRVGHM